MSSKQLSADEVISRLGDDRDRLRVLAHLMGWVLRQVDERLILDEGSQHPVGMVMRVGMWQDLVGDEQLSNGIPTPMADEVISRLRKTQG